MMMRRILAIAAIASFAAACAGPPGPPGPPGPAGGPLPTGTPPVAQAPAQPPVAQAPVQRPAQVAPAPAPVGVQPGAQRPAPLMSSAASFGDLWFMPGQAQLLPQDGGTINTIADHMRRNPQHMVGIDGHADPNNYELSERRVIAVRDALISAGVPANRISIGAFGDPQLRRDGRVEVLLADG
jgi:outer membrane protein OmpA-like peptidoglycan-associated protein